MTASRRYGMRSLRFKLVLASIVVEALMLTVLVWNSTRITGNALQEIFQDRVETLTPLLNVSLVNPLAQRDFAILEERLKTIVDHNSLVYIEVRDELGQLAASHGTVPETARFDASFEVPDHIYHHTFDITLAGRAVGRARYGLNVGLLEATLANLRKQGILVASAEILLTALLLATLGALLTRRLLTLARAARALQGGDYSTRVPVVGRDEVADAAQAFNVMADALARDIAERAQAERALKESEERFRATFEQAAVGIAQVAPDGRWLHVNQKLCDIVGYSREELLRCSFQDITHPDDLDADLALVRRMLAGEIQTYSMEKRYVRKDGALIWIDLTVGLVRQPTGDPKYFISVVEDISERKRTEAALQESQRTLATLISNLPGVVYRCRNDKDWTTEFISAGAFTLFGYPAPDFLAGKVQVGQLIHPDDRERVWGAIQTALKDKRSYTLTYRLVPASGQEKWAWEQGQGIFSPSGELLYLEGFATDITDRVHAETAMRESEERLRLALDAAHMGTFDWDVPSNRIAWSRWHEELWGFRSGEFGGTYEAFSARVHPDDLPGIDTEVARCIAAREPFAREFRVVWPDGSTHWISGRGEFAFGADGQPLRMRGVVVDITARKQAERQITDYAGRLAHLSRRLLAAQEDERRRVARELHDELGQALTVLKINLQARERLKDRAPAGLDIDNIRIVDDALQQVRRLALALRPSMLDDLGLLPALRWMVDQTAGHAGFVAHLDTDIPELRLSPEVETACFRIVQEALTNVARHAQARRVRIELRREDGMLALAVQDDGRGFNTVEVYERAKAGGSIGVLGMQERAALAGGRLEIESAPGGGTTVRAKIPWRLADPGKEISG